MKQNPNCPLFPFSISGFSAETIQQKMIITKDKKVRQRLTDHVKINYGYLGLRFLDQMQRVSSNLAIKTQ